MSYISGFGRTGALVLGALLTGLGLLLVALAARSGSSALLLGGALAIAGVVRLTTAASAASRARAHPADPSDPRWRGGSGEIQLAGRRCVECKRRITVASEGVVCDGCSDPVHADCQQLHRALAHRGGSPAPLG